MKLMISIIIIGVLAFFLLDDSLNLSVSAMGYEFTFSLVLLIVAAIFCLLLWHLMKKPFHWWKNWQLKKAQQKEATKQGVLTEALINVLAHQTGKNKILCKQSIALWGKESEIHLIMKALFEPDSATFTQMIHVPSLALAGYYGLYQKALSAGNMEECATLLKQVADKYPDTPWILQGLFELALWNKDFENAPLLLKRWQKVTPLSDDFIRKQRAFILFKTGKLKEAFDLDPTNSDIVLAYAKKESKKAVKILTAGWSYNPQWPLFQMLLRTIKTLPAKKQEAIVLDFTRQSAQSKMSLLAKAVLYMRLENWIEASEILTMYLDAFPLTKPICQMMAVIYRRREFAEADVEAWLKKEHVALPAPYPETDDFS